MEIVLTEPQHEDRSKTLQRGAPSKAFEDISVRSKKGKSAEITETVGATTESLFQALILNLNKEGRPKDAKILKCLMKSDIDGSIFCTKTYSLEEALALMLGCRIIKLFAWGP